MLMVSPSALMAMSELRIDSGIDTAIMMRLRQLPRKIRIIIAVRQAAMMASRITPLMRRLTKIDWSVSGVHAKLGQHWSYDGGQLLADAGDDVQRRAEPVFRIFISVARWPSTRTILV